MNDTFNAQNEAQPAPAPQQKPQKSRPQYRVWLVQDQPDGKAKWTEICGLWPTQTNAGFKGNLKKPLAATEGRIVVMPVKDEATDKPN